MDKNFNEFLQLQLLNSIEGIGLRTISLLLNEFSDVSSIIEAGEHNLLSVQGITKPVCRNIKNFDFKKSPLIPKLKDIYERTISNGYSVINYLSRDYPQKLKTMYDPPIVLYTCGNTDYLNNNSLSVVGTRNNTIYGKMLTEKLVEDLSLRAVTIVSGMAKGIDTIAHKTALKNFVPTIAVIGSGLDVIYPSENKNLFNQISENGLIVSEFPLGTKPDAKNFPQRNRIISALSLGTIIIETRLKGGAMQTAHLALDQGKEVFALPGNVGSPNSEGTNYLIQNGLAKLITKAEDILEEFSFDPVESKEKTLIPDLSLFEQNVFNSLTYDPVHIDNIALKTNYSVQECLSILLMLEIKGVVQQQPGKTFLKTNNV